MNTWTHAHAPRGYELLVFIKPIERGDFAGVGRFGEFAGTV
jgi:hypothetical protein